LLVKICKIRLAVRQVGGERELAVSPNLTADLEVKALRKPNLHAYLLTELRLNGGANCT